MYDTPALVKFPTKQFQEVLVYIELFLYSLILYLNLCTGEVFYKTCWSNSQHLLLQPVNGDRVEGVEQLNHDTHN